MSSSTKLVSGQFLVVLITLITKSSTSSNSYNYNVTSSLCENLTFYNVSHHLGALENFLSTGNVSEGLHLVELCQEHLTSCPDIEGVKNMCLFYTKTHRISHLWSVCQEKKAKWVQSNEGFNPDKHRPLRSQFDVFGECLVLLFEELDSLEGVDDIGVELNETFIAGITTLENADLVFLYLERQIQYSNLLFNAFYVRLTMMVVFFVVGLVGNGTMILIFIQQRDMRTQSNMMLLNLAVVDILNLLISLPTVTGFKLVEYLTPAVFDDVTCKVIVFILALFTGLTVFSVVALSMFRFVAVYNASSTPSTPRCGVCSKHTSSMHILFVWVLSIIFAVPTVVSFGTTPAGFCDYTNVTMAWLWNLVVHSVVSVLIIVVLYVLTAMRIAYSARHMPGEGKGQEAQKMARNRSARVLVAISVVFVVSFVPYNLSVAFLVWNILGIKSSIAIGNLYCLLYLSSMANPFALICTSRRFRKYFVFYLCRPIQFRSCHKQMSDSQISIVRTTL